MKFVVVLLCAIVFVVYSASANGIVGGSTTTSDKCLTGAGYSWCAFEGKCVRPWELAKEKGLEMTAENINSYCNVQRMGGSQDSHGCISTAGYSWCAKEKNCVRPWELATARQVSINTMADFTNYCNVNDTTTTTTEVGNDVDANKCLVSAGYSFCKKENKCVKSWELMKTLGLESTPISFQTYCSNCLASAGYSYCYAEQKCVRPWELAKELAIESTPESIHAYCAQEPSVAAAGKTVALPIGGASDHGCLVGAGYSWCQKEGKCVKPWELTASAALDNTPEAFDSYCNGVSTTTVVGGDASDHGCLVGAGYSWCQKEGKCVRPWELATEKSIIGMTAESFAAYCQGV